jgi:tRNA(Arg) A34 adenosine deaminase TadA
MSYFRQKTTGFPFEGRLVRDSEEPRRQSPLAGQAAERPSRRGYDQRMRQWDELEPVWREVFHLMWESYVTGTIPVGAVVADRTGEILSRGRNRIFDANEDGQLSRSRLAHAEINALVGLPSNRTYESFTLYTALEPCHLCLSAAIAVRVGTVQYAAADPYGGAVGKLVPSADHRAHPVAIEGPLTGAAARLPELLHIAHFLWRLPNGGVMRFYRERRPELVAVAATLPAPDAGASLADAFSALP